MSRLTEVDQVYRCQRTAPVFHDIEDPRYRDLSRIINTFYHELGTDQEDPFWERLLRTLKRYSFYLGAAPLPFSYIRSTDWLTHLEEDLSLVPRLNPQLTRLAEIALEQLGSLAGLTENPMLGVISELITTVCTGSIAVVVKDARLVTETESVLANLFRHSLKVVTPQSLARTECYDCLIVIGACRWFPAYLFEAPRASSIHVVRYRGLNDKPQQHAAFISNTSPAVRMPQPARNTLDIIDVIGSYSAINWSRVAANLRRTSVGDAEHEDVDAALVVLEGGCGVFVDIGGQVLVLDPVSADDDQGGSLRRMSARQLQPGMGVLLRTAGGGDLIIPTANRLMGKKTEEYRAGQREWKARLKAMVKKHGTQAVCARLSSLGCLRAAPHNLRVWMADRSIRPQDFEDFQAITRLVGLAGSAERLWRNADEIETAHRKAGFLIRDLLLQQVKNADISQLQRQGRLDFVLPEEEGGSLTAFAVQAVMDELYQVPMSQLGRLIEEDDHSNG